MVYEKKCAECGKILDFGGRDKGRLPENGIEFDGEIYCKECVQNFVQFGIGNVIERLDSLESDMKDVKDAIGLEKH